MLWYPNPGEPIARHETDGLLVTCREADGVVRIQAIGAYRDLAPQYPDLPVTHWPGLCIAHEQPFGGRTGETVAQEPACRSSGPASGPQASIGANSSTAAMIGRNASRGCAQYRGCRSQATPGRRPKSSPRASPPAIGAKLWIGFPGVQGGGVGLGGVGTNPRRRESANPRFRRSGAALPRGRRNRIGSTT
jgi:hypothetical protein